MQAEIVMIGTELLLGELVDTNANRLAKELRDIGMDLYYKTTVGDNETRISEVLNLALDRSDVVITSGGLGPTVDDVTRQAAAKATGRRLIYSIDLEEQISDKFRTFGREMAENNKRQAYIPEGAMPLPNPVGTAPCFLSEDIGGRGFIITLPGVPRELDYMMKNMVNPILVERMGGIKITKVQVLRTCSVGESNLDRAIGDLMLLKNPTVGLAAHTGQTDVRITAKADSHEEADKLITKMELQLRERLGISIYGMGKETVPDVVGKLLKEKGLKIGIADTLVNGQVVQMLAESGFEELVDIDLHTKTISEIVESTDIGLEKNPESMVRKLAQHVAPEEGLGLSMIGPFENNTNYIALYHWNRGEILKRGRNFQDSDHNRKWISIQGLDWIRRMLLGKLKSPID